MRRYFVIPLPNTPAVQPPIPIPTPSLTAIATGANTVSLTASYTGPPTLAAYNFYQFEGGTWILLVTSASGTQLQTQGSVNIVTQSGLEIVTQSGLTGNSYVVSGLAANTTYQFKVTITTAETPPRTSGPGFASATTVTSPPAQVTGLAVTGQTASTIALSWSAAASATSYNIEVNGVAVYSGITTTAYTVSGLAASSTYTFNVAGTNVAGTGPYSSSVNGTTTAGSTALAVNAGTGTNSGKLVNQNGTVIRLFGVAYSGMEIGPAFGASDPWSGRGFGTVAGSNGVAGTIPSITYYVSRGINVFRIPMNVQAITGYAATTGSGAGTNTNPLNNYLQTLDKVRAQNLAAGVYTQFDFHWNAPDGYLAGQQQIMADNDHTPAAVGVIAARYKNCPDVILELYNEPHCDSVSSSNQNSLVSAGGTASSINTGANGAGGTVTGVNWTMAGYQSLIYSARASGFPGLLLCGGNNFSHDLTWWQGSTAPVDTAPAGYVGTWAPNIGMSYHNYNDGTYNIVGSTSAATISMLSAGNNGTAVPVVITEFGDYSGWTYGATLVSICDAHGWSYIAWNGDPTSSSVTPNLTNSWPPSAATLTAYGTGYLNHVSGL